MKAHTLHFFHTHTHTHTHTKCASHPWDSFSENYQGYARRFHEESKLAGWAGDVIEWLGVDTWPSMVEWGGEWTNECSRGIGNYVYTTNGMYICWSENSLQAWVVPYFFLAWWASAFIIAMGCSLRIVRFAMAFTPLVSRHNRHASAAVISGMFARLISVQWSGTSVREQLTVISCSVIQVIHMHCTYSSFEANGRYLVTTCHSNPFLELVIQS